MTVPGWARQPEPVRDGREPFDDLMDDLEGLLDGLVIDDDLNIDIRPCVGAAAGVASTEPPRVHERQRLERRGNRIDDHLPAHRLGIHGPPFARFA